MGYSCCVPGCKSNYKKDEPSVAVFKFPSIGELLQNIQEYVYNTLKSNMCMVLTFTKIPITYTVSDVVLIKLLYCTYTYY